MAYQTRFFFSVILGFVGLLATGCGSSSNSGSGCEGDTECDLGQTCVDGTCVSAPDAGRPGRDAGRRLCRDLDGDGYEGMTEECPTGTDCNDNELRARPGEPELCGDGLDNDCDGESDETDCVCGANDRVVCYSGPPATRRVGACRNGVAVCSGPGEVGPCTGEILPEEEICDFVDNDCDGEVDEGLRNACGECSATTPVETCGDGLDNDCDGMVDEECDCNFECMCAPMTTCVCNPPTNQPCYEGPFGTDGQGICAGGRRDCVLDATSSDYIWGVCTGQTLPAEECAGGAANGADDDCDGVVDEGCRDEDGDGSPWPTDCDDTDDTVHPDAPEVCDGRDNNCDGVPDEGVTNRCGGCYTPAATDECDNGLDDDCNGLIDDGCVCSGTQACYGGPPGTAGTGACQTGTQTCGSGEFATWGDCEGQVLPSPEVCDGVDNDCDGEADERWAVNSNACGFCDDTEICDDEDNDCDGLIDENVANRCGECAPEPTEVCNGMDDDCDGVVDENVTNACGTCPPEPCFTETWDEPSDCAGSGTVCSGVEPDPDFPDSITLGSTSFDLDYIYIAVTQRNEVAQIDTTSGAKNWQVSSHGTHPSRTAVAQDGSVWVANRGFANPNNVANSNVVHLRESDGSLICRAPVIGLARGLALDANGDVWAGTWNGRRVWKISGTNVDNTTTPPTCEVISDFDVGERVYGLAADPEGYVWTSSRPNTVRINAATEAFTTVANATNYGIAADGADNMWFGGWLGSGVVHAIQRSTGTVFNTSVGNVTAVTVHPDGSVWGSSYGTHEVVKIDPGTGVRLCGTATINGTRPHGVAVDRMGRVWSPNRYGGYVNVYDPDDCSIIASHPVDVGQELYSYSDMTGHLLRTFIAPEGFWSQVFDSGYATPYWTRVEWDSNEPAGTGVEVTVRVADTVPGLDMATPCGPFTSSPADLSTCTPALDQARYLRIDVRLFRSATQERPRFDEARAYWAY